MLGLFRRGLNVPGTLALLLFVSIGAPARPAAGNLHGTVTSTSGTPVPGVVVAAITERGRVKVAITDDQGRYSIAALSSGRYTIWAGGSGFSLYENFGIKVAAGRARELDIRLQPSWEGPASLASERDETGKTYIGTPVAAPESARPGATQ